MRKPGEELHYEYVTFIFREHGLEIRPTPEGIASAKEYLSDPPEKRTRRPTAIFLDMIADALGNGWEYVSGQVALWGDDCEILSEDGHIADSGKWEPSETCSAEDPCYIYVHTAYAVVLPVEAFAEGKSIFLARDEIELEPKDRVIRLPSGEGYMADAMDHESGRTHNQTGAARVTRKRAHEIKRELRESGCRAVVVRLVPKAKRRDEPAEPMSEQAMREDDRRRADCMKRVLGGFIPLKK